MNGFLQDFRYALRQLRKSPGFACTAILVLTLGMCASVSIFAFVDAALIRPLPYPNPNRLVDVTESVAMIPRANLSYPDYLDWKRLNQVFSSMDVYGGTGYLLRTSAGTEPVPGTRVSDGFFHTLGITPVLGRDFYRGEDLPAAPRTVILSYSTWQNRFGGRKDVIGETVLSAAFPTPSSECCPSTSSSLLEEKPSSGPPFMPLTPVPSGEVATTLTGSHGSKRGLRLRRL